MEDKTSRVKRTKLWEKIHQIVSQIPRENVEGDAMDAESAAVSLEELFLAWISKTFPDKPVEAQAQEYNIHCRETAEDKNPRVKPHYKYGRKRRSKD